jgi:hypothetical protein
MNIDALVVLFNKNNDDFAQKIEQGSQRLGPAALRRSSQVERWLHDPVVNKPHEAWPILNALVENVDDRPDGAMEYLGAYLVEEFVRLHGVEFLDLLEAAARDSARWRRALAVVYGWDDPTLVHARVSARLMPYVRRHREVSASSAGASSGTIAGH